MRVWIAVTTALIATAQAVTATRAAEFCVTCDGPSARYTCSFGEHAAGSVDARLKLYCITELAKAGPHATCAVERATSTPCGGVVKTFAMPDGMLAPAPATAEPAPQTAPPPSPATATPAKTQPNVNPAAAAPDSPPKTVKEMVEKGNASTAKALEKSGESAADAVKSTGSAIEKAGTAVGNAAKKTWNCITSLFGDC